MALDKATVARIATLARIKLNDDEAVRVAQSLGYPVVLKAQSSELPHKSDVGGVEVGLANEAALRQAGVPSERIHIERFGVPPDQSQGPAHAPQPGDADDARVVLIHDGLTREFGFRKGDPSVLDAAARAGLDVPYSCKSGVCATCRCKVVEGKVRMDRNFALEKADLEAGFVLSCQAHPLTERVVLSFDER